jgi:two-component system response regulator PhoP
MRLLIVEDDSDLQGQLKRLLEQAGHDCELAADGAEALYFARDYSFDMAIVDLGLPKVDGIEVIQTLRAEQFSFPVLVLTARSSWKAKVSGLDAGADDYLTKPFQAEELLARVNALLRRANGFSHSRLTVGPIALDTSTSTVYLHDEELSLTAFEFKVLEHFLMNPGKVTTRTTLLDRLYDDHDEDGSNVLDVIIARLRKKLDPDGSLKPITTLRGRGYRFFTGAHRDP